MKFGAKFWLLMALGVAPLAMAQNSRIAVVDLKAAVGAHPASKALEAELQTKGGNANSVLNAKREELANIGKEGQEMQANPLSRGLDGKLLPEVIEELGELQKRATELQRSMLELQTKTRADLSQDRDTGLGEIADKIAAIVKDVNGGRFDIVFDKSPNSRSGLPQVLDYSGATDITDEVIAKIAAQNPTPAKP